MDPLDWAIDADAVVSDQQKGEKEGGEEAAESGHLDSVKVGRDYEGKLEKGSP